MMLIHAVAEVPESAGGAGNRFVVKHAVSKRVVAQPTRSFSRIWMLCGDVARAITRRIAFDPASTAASWTGAAT
jgi:hypothetical protein